MFGEPVAIWSTVLVAVGAGYLFVAFRARNVWEEPGGELYTGLGIALAVGASFGLAGILIGETHRWSLHYLASEVFIIMLPVIWAAFVARRAGANWLPRRRAGWLTLGFLLLMVEVRIAELLVDGTAVQVDSFNPDYVLLIMIPMMVTYLASSSFLVIGIALLGKQTLEYEHLPGAPVVAASASVVVPWLATWVVFSIADMYDAGTVLAVLGTGFGVGLVGYVLAYGRYDLFAASAAAGTIGRNRVIATMDDAVVVVDDESRILDLNPAAAKLFEASVEDVAGRPIHEVVGEDLDTIRTTEVIELLTVIGRREFDPTVSTVTGPDGEKLGYSLVLRDVTERRNREQRLAVLNRVLRHNLRNEMSIVSGYAEMLLDGERTDDDRIADDIATTANQLMELGEKARVIEQMMSEPPTTAEPTDVDELARRAIDNVRSRASDCEFDVQIPPNMTVNANPRVLQPVVENLLENAVEHNDAAEPRVEIKADLECDDESVSITVVDNGPGIPEHERDVLESGDISPLDHGSGLGLWVSKWGATRLGGALSLATAEPRGTVATVRFPTSVTKTTHTSLASS